MLNCNLKPIWSATSVDCSHLAVLKGQDPKEPHVQLVVTHKLNEKTHGLILEAHFSRWNEIQRIRSEHDSPHELGIDTALSRGLPGFSDLILAKGSYSPWESPWNVRSGRRMWVISPWYLRGHLGHWLQVAAGQASALADCLVRLHSADFCRLWLKSLPKVSLLRPMGQVTPSKLWLKESSKVKSCRPLGNVTRSRPWLKASLKVKLWRLAGKITCSKLLLNRSPKVRLWRLLGRVIPSRLWLKQNPNVRLWRPSGKVAWTRLSSKPKPKVKCWRFIGHATPSKLWTQIKLWRPAGKVRSSRRSNWLSGRLTFAMFWLKLAPNFNDWRFGSRLPRSGWSAGQKSSLANLLESPHALDSG